MIREKKSFACEEKTKCKKVRTKSYDTLKGGIWKQRSYEGGAF